MLSNFGINNIYILQFFTLLYVIATAAIRFLFSPSARVGTRGEKKKKKIGRLCFTVVCTTKELHVVLVIIIAQIRHTFDVHTGVRLNVRPMQSQ